MKKIIISFLYLSSLNTFGMTLSDDWNSSDKYQHVAAGALIGSSIAKISQNEKIGFYTGVGIGVLKEAYDANYPNEHTASYKDLGATILGSYIGANFGGYWILKGDKNNISIKFTKSFN